MCINQRFVIEFDVDVFEEGELSLHEELDFIDYLRRKVDRIPEIAPGSVNVKEAFITCKE